MKASHRLTGKSKEVTAFLVQHIKAGLTNDEIIRRYKKFSKEKLILRPEPDASYLTQLRAKYDPTILRHKQAKVEIEKIKRVQIRAEKQVQKEALRQYRIQHFKESPAYSWVKDRLIEGHPEQIILEELNMLCKQFPERFYTPSGRDMSRRLLSEWRQQIEEESD